MRALEFTAEIDAQNRVSVVLPDIITPGRVRVLVLVPETTEQEVEKEDWMRGIAREWSAELADEHEDIYSLEDGEPVDAAR